MAKSKPNRSSWNTPDVPHSSLVISIVASRSKRSARFWEALLLGLALMAAFLSASYARQQAAFEKVAARSIPAQATLRLLEVRESEGNWSAIGKFDVVTDVKLGTLEGDLAPLQKKKIEHRSREEAEALKEGWQIGQTYNGFWNPDRPLSVAFAKPDPLGNAQTVLGLQILSALLFLSAIFLNVRRRRS